MQVGPQSGLIIGVKSTRPPNLKFVKMTLNQGLDIRRPPGYVEGVWRVFGRHMRGVWNVSEECMQGIIMVSRHYRMGEPGEGQGGTGQVKLVKS